MANVSIEEKVDEFFNIKNSKTGNFVSVKMPWNTTYRWVESDVYSKFRSDIITLIQGQKK